jgi:hypothetical protein
LAVETQARDSSAVSDRPTSRAANIGKTEAPMFDAKIDSPYIAGAALAVDEKVVHMLAYVS